MGTAVPVVAVLLLLAPASSLVPAPSRHGWLGPQSLRATPSGSSSSSSSPSSSSSSSSSTPTSSSNWSERDAAWMNNQNVVEYVVGGAGAGDEFGALAQSFGLNISSELSRRTVVPHHLTTAYDLFCNRELNMRQIEAVGFDMDWTLAQYNEAFDLLAYNGAKEKLVNWLGYPASTLDLVYSQDMHRRGCLIDKKRGNVLKLDRHKYVIYAEHGLQPIGRDERKKLYRQNYQGIQDMSGPSYTNTDTPFSLVDSCLFAQLVDLKDREGAASPFLAAKSYEQIWNDMRKCVDRCHKDGVIKSTVAQCPEKYITYDPNIFPMLDAFRRAGRKVFLLTNSLWDYTQVVMNYLEGRKAGADKDLAWTEYFDIVIVGGNKPAFLTDERSLALFQVDVHKDGALLNVDSVPSEPDAVDSFLADCKFFQGGNAHMLMKMLKLTAGDRLLYVGDHMYADILRSKRTLGWRTCLVVPELTGEITTHKKNRAQRTELLALRREQFLLESRLDKASQEDPSASQGAEIDALQARLTHLRTEIEEKLEAYNRAFHPRWGPLFKAGFQESRFASQVTDFACLYTSRASNLGLVSPQRPFRPVRDKMPHDSFLEGL